MGVSLQQQRCEEVAGVHLFPLRSACLVYHPLQQAADGARQLQLVGTLAGYRLQPVAEERLQPGPQHAGLAAAGAYYCGPVVVVQQRVQQVLQGHELVTPDLRLAKRRGQGQLHVTTQHSSSLLQ